MELKSDGGILTKIEFEWEKSEKQNLDLLNIQFPRKVLPRIVPADEIEDKSGNLNLYLNIESSSKMFPNLLEYFSPLQISIILSTSRLVGIKCPGLYSIYTELNLSFCAVNECTTLEYGVEKFNKRFGKVLISLLAPGSEGFIQAFIRPKEREQSNFLEIKKKVNEDEFRYQSALIIGGSRGLGEVTVKLLAAGSADVKLTYHQGEEDANRIVKEINSNGGTANCFQYDVLSPDQDSFYNALNDWRPTHLYYFATPFIFSGTKGIFSDILFKKFCDYYISGFINIINMLRPLELRNIFYPSSIAIDELPSNMGEYVSAKIAGEMLCMFFEQNYNDITIYRPRLPRMDTDQTVSLFPVKNEDPVPIQLEHLRLLNSGSDLK
jgi:hypothetical protein